jgi:[pyruvate, water dikinase]-phosphate phosphotransferase / [pyruvate, water dikinase] kinase
MVTRLNGDNRWVPGLHPILIVSGGSGMSGEQLVNTVLAQFPESRVQVITVPNVRTESQVEAVAVQAQATGATLVHTLVDDRLRAYLIERTTSLGVQAIDLMGPLLTQLAQALGCMPLGQPGLYRQLNKAYFDRVEAIDFTMTHDDGMNPEGWSEAEIVLVGVSRAGKTPLSLYLSVLGWKVANIPVVPGLDLAAELFQLDRQRVFGLTLDVGPLLAFRLQRQKSLGVPGASDYTNPEKLYEELETALKLCKRCGFTIINVGEKPIESTADEIIRIVSARFGVKSRPG